MKNTKKKSIANILLLQILGLIVITSCLRGDTEENENEEKTNKKLKKEITAEYKKLGKNVPKDIIKSKDTTSLEQALEKVKKANTENDFIKNFNDTNEQKIPEISTKFVESRDKFKNYIINRGDILKIKKQEGNQTTYNVIEAKQKDYYKLIKERILKEKELIGKEKDNTEKYNVDDLKSLSNEEIEEVLKDMNN